MLVLSRKIGEDFYIGDSLVKVLDVSRNRAKLGIIADPALRVLRGELLTREPPTLPDIPAPDQSSDPPLEGYRSALCPTK